MWTPKEHYKKLKQPNADCFSCNECCWCLGERMAPVLTRREAKYFLMHYPASLKNVNRIKQNKKCFFSKDNKCAVYENRPLDCRMYPVLSLGNALTFDYDCKIGSKIDKKFIRELVQLLKQEPPSYLVELHKASTVYQGNPMCKVVGVVR